MQGRGQRGAARPGRRSHRAGTEKGQEGGRQLPIPTRLQVRRGLLGLDVSAPSTFTEDLLRACGGTVDSERRPSPVPVGGTGELPGGHQLSRLGAESPRSLQQGVCQHSGGSGAGGGPRRA